MKSGWIAAAATAALAAAAPATAGAAARATTIATATSVDYRAEVTARKGSGGAAPTAAMSVTTYRRGAGGWRRAGVRRLRGTYFWKTVTAPHAVCRLELATASGAASTRPLVRVQLLASPALGCARTETIPLPAV
jgi:hypothetical protein